MKLLILASILLAAHGKRSASVLDNGLAQTQVLHYPKETQFAPRCKVTGTPLNLLIILDSSGSLKELFGTEQEVVKDIVKTVALHPDYTRMALIQYSGYARTEFNFLEYDSDSISQNQRRVSEHVDGLRFITGITRTGVALNHSLSLLNEDEGYRPGVRTIALLVHDGRSRDKPRNLGVVMADKLRARGVELYAYGTGNWVAEEDLIKLTGDPKKVFAHSDKIKQGRPYSDLLKLFKEFEGEEVCEEVPICIPGSDKPVDLMFVMDGSQSVENSYKAQLDFLHKIIRPINVHPEAVRVAMVQYAGKPRSEFQFLDYQSAERVEKAIDRIEQISGTTRTNAALALAEKELREDPGRRKGVPSVVVVLTDGHSKNRVGEPARRLGQTADFVYAVSVSPDILVDETELFDISGQWQNVYMRNNLTAFEERLMSHFSFGCPGLAVDGKENYEPIVKGPVSVQCSRNKVSIEVRTKRPFEGVLYAASRYDDSSCAVRGNGRTDTISLDLSSERCGIKRTPQPNGYKYSGSVVLQFHPDAVTKVDQVFDIDCFHKDPSAQRKLGELNLKLPSECSYFLRKLSPEGCIALDARVGEDIYHTWQCDADSTQYGFLTHSCEVEGDTGERIQLSDSNGCPIDEALFGVPTYYNNGRAVLHRDVFRLPKSTHMRFRCKISVCDKAAGGCDHVLPPQCAGGRRKRAATQKGLPTFDVHTRWLASMDSDVERSTKAMHYCSV